MFFRDRIVRSLIAALASLIVKFFCISSALQSLLNALANAVPLSAQILLGRYVFVILLKNARTIFLESFVFIPFASTVPSKRS